MSKSILLKLGLGTLGVGSVAAPSAVAAHKSKRLDALTEDRELKLEDMDKREYALEGQTKELILKRDTVKHMEDSVVMQIKYLLDQAEKYKGIYQQQLDKNEADLRERDQLRQKIEDLQADLISKKQLVAIQKKSIIDQFTKVRGDIDKLKKSHSRALTYASWLKER